jgi:hypothetical protein
VLLPFDDDKPYVSALITDDIDLEDDQNYLAHIFNEDEFEDSDDDEAVDKD